MTPAHIIEQRRDWDRWHTTSWQRPRYEEFWRANLPRTNTSYTVRQVNETIAWAREQCASEWMKVKGQATWAMQTKKQGGFTAMTDRERFDIACRRLKIARIIRDSWSALA